MDSSNTRRRQFKKSSYSPIFKAADPRCVGVSITADDVLVINTKDDRKTLKFTHQEWDAFLRGVRNGEFDIR